MALVKHGAAIFATTFSDGSMALEKCDPYREGYTECFSYLAGACSGGVGAWDWQLEQGQGAGPVPCSPLTNAYRCRCGAGHGLVQRRRGLRALGLQC